MNTKIYVDMDGVLANFDSQPNALNRFITERKFFQFLKPLPFVKKLNRMLQENNENIYILSSSPNDDADYDKYLWLKRHVPNIRQSHIIFVRSGAEKAKYAKFGDILIDDYSTNLIQWEEKGGTGIKMLNRNSSRTKWKGKCYSDNL